MSKHGDTVMTQKYSPVSCELYDQLETLVLRRIDCNFEFRCESEQIESTRCRVVDLYSSKGEEFMELSDGNLIRLDKLVRINGQAVGDGCTVF